MKSISNFFILSTNVFCAGLVIHETVKKKCTYVFAINYMNINFVLNLHRVIVIKETCVFQYVLLDFSAIFVIKYIISFCIDIFV